MEERSPQCEDGFTRLANELLEAMLRAKFTGREWGVLMAVARKTYGFGKKADYLSHGQMAKLTGIERTHVCKICHHLAKRNILTVAAEGHTTQNKIAIQKDYSRWCGVAPRSHGVAKITESVAAEGHRSVAVEGTHKRKKENTKETTLQNFDPKDFPFSNDPKFKDLWEAFLIMRVSMKAKPTAKGIELLMKKLHKQPLAVACEMLELSIENNWKGLFPPKGSPSKPTAGTQSSSAEPRAARIDTTGFERPKA